MIQFIIFLFSVSHRYYSTGSWPGHLSDFILDPAALMVSGKVKCLDELMPKLFAAGSKVSEMSLRGN